LKSTFLSISHVAFLNSSLLGLDCPAPSDLVLLPKPLLPLIPP